jgi:hypothetical protein
MGSGGKILPHSYTSVPDGGKFRENYCISLIFSDIQESGIFMFLAYDCDVLEHVK